MVFSTTNLFKNIPCPEGHSCTLTSCIFAHDLRPQDTQAAPGSSSQRAEERQESEPAAKRRRIAYDKAEDKPPSKADLIRNQLAKERTKPKSNPSASLKTEPTKPTPPSLTRSVSPPAKTNGKATSPQVAAANKTASASTAAKSTAVRAKETLNPRLVPNDPAGHAKRTIYLKHLHGEMARLNEMLIDRSKSGAVQFKAGLLLDDIELIQLALDEEEKLARGQGSVYGNVVKNRIAAYKKMKADDWIVYVKTTSLFTKKTAPPARHPGQPDPPKQINTGLTPDEEVAILPHLVINDQKPLAQFGYIPFPPTAVQAAEAAAAVEASKNYEICDRCTARFQMFPHRNEEGQLTSNGPCRHHPNRKVFPQRTKADTGPKEPYYPCCNEVVGSAGCTSTENHVFKASSPARLAAVLPFLLTPVNERPAVDGKGRRVGAVAFDCEMGYTTLGLELIRLTAVSWPQGEELVDVLVRPLGIVLDLNSRFSGVWPEDMANAVPYVSQRTPSPRPPPPPQLDGSATSSPPPPPPPLPIVDSPQKARELLCSFLTPGTPLIGHAIENDLNATRLCYPTVIDTVIIFPHPRGLPLRYGLRMLSAKHLSRQIQTGGERGHDSLEDARATGDLVRVKVGEKWRLLRGAGWEFVGGVLVPPKTGMAKGAGLEVEVEGRAESDGVLADGLVERAIKGGVRKRGRKRGGMDGAGDSTEEEEESVQRGNGLSAFLQRGKAEEGGGEHKLSAAYLEGE
ncbi:hypothetical protein LTR85_001388 [Meristemomyces frigidus]|nr:hypothetical protein LTR85_001388 [Meristemomyces frigidus]